MRTHETQDTSQTGRQPGMVMPDLWNPPWPYTTRKSAQSSKNRHDREVHDGDGPALAGQRKARDADRKRTYRQTWIPSNGECAFLALGPQGRCDMLEQTSGALVGAGIDPHAILRKDGIDVSKHSDVKRSHIITQ